MRPWTAYAIAWLSMAWAVASAIEKTGKWGLLFFMLIPGCISIRSGGDKKDE